MPTATARHYAEKVRDTLKAIAEADERNLNLLTSREFGTNEYTVAAREARGLRAALLLHAANLAEAVLAETSTEPVSAAIASGAAPVPAWAGCFACGGQVNNSGRCARCGGTQYACRCARASEMAQTPTTRCGAEFAGHVCGLMRGHETSTKHWDQLTDMEWT